MLKIDEAIRRKFRIAYGGSEVNFITPIIVGYGETDEHYYEISKGREEPTVQNFGPFFGVTVITKSSKKTNLSTSFDSMTSAIKYAESLP